MPLKKYRDKARAQGRCIVCASPRPERKPLPGKSKCRHCMTRTVKFLMRKYRETRLNRPDLCPRCKRVMDEDDAAYGSVWCIACSTQNQAIQGRSV